jgi:hypothetical protein
MTNNAPNFVCNSCGAEIYALIPPRLDVLHQACHCRGNFLRKHKYQKYSDKFPPKAMIELNTENTISQGDCFGICIKKLFLLNGKQDFETVYRCGYGVKYDKQELDGNGLYDTDGYVIANMKRYEAALRGDFDITMQLYKNITFETIAQQLSNRTPVIITIAATLTKWTGQTIAVPHAFLITGYDIDSETYICVDPSYGSDYLTLAFDIVEYNDATGFVFDFTKFHEQNPCDELGEELKEVYLLLETTPTSEEFRKLNEAIRHNRPYLSQYNHGAYALNNVGNGEIYSRFACKTTFFKYLYEKYGYEWLMDISNRYAEIYKQSAACLTLFLKYWMTASENDLERYLQIIYQYETAEREIEEILLRNKPFIGV